MSSRREQRRLEAHKRRQLQPLKQGLARAEEYNRLSTLQAELAQQLADPGLYQAGDKERLHHLLRRKGELDRRLAEAEEKLEAARRSMA